MWRRTLLTNTKPAARTTRAELKDAMMQARPLAAQLRAALDMRASLGPAPMLKAAGALRETIGSLRSDIRSIANRAYMDDEEVLICLLAEEDRLRASYRRLPTLDQVQRAISRSIGNAERDLHAANEAANEARERLEEATRAAVATAAAGVLLGSAA